MRRVVITLLAASMLGFVSPLAGPVSCMANEQMEWETYRRVIEPESIQIADDLHIRDNFDSDRHCGLIQSQAAFNRLWAALISSKTPYTSRFGIGLPDPPEVDFEKYSVIWFADRETKPSIVDSITVAAYDNDKSLFVTIVVKKQGAGTQGINLWKIPKTDYSPEFSILRDK